MKKHTIRRLAAVAAVALLPVVSSSTGASAAKGEGPDVNAQPVSKLRKGGTFTWAINALPDNYNPSQLDGNTADTGYIMGALLPGFFTVNARGALVVDRNYATNVVLTRRKPKQVVTYSLNPRARWSDGKAIGLADFQGMWKAHNGTNKDYVVASTVGYEDIESVRAGKKKGDIVVTFKKVYADWQGLFGGLLPASLTKDPATYNTSWKDGPPTNLSAGPFRYQATDVTGGTVTLVPNTRWWGAKPVLSKIVYRAIDPGAQLDALANGEVNYIDIGPSASQYTRAKGLKGLKVHVSKAPNYRHMTFGSKGLAANQTIRQAIMMSIDRNVVAKAMIGPIDPKVTSLDNHIFVKGLSCYKDTSGIYGKQNLQRVNTMLNAAGWTGNPRKNSAGDTLELTITIPSGVPTSAQEAQLFQAMLAPAGIKLNIETVDINDFFDVYILPGNYEMTVFSWIGTLFPISGSTAILKSDGDSNFGKIGNATIDRLLAQANSELDQKKRCDLATRISTEAWKVGHSMITYQRPNVTATSTKVANMGSWGFSSLDYTKIGFMR